MRFFKVHAFQLNIPKFFNCVKYKFSNTKGKYKDSSGVGVDHS